MNESDFIITVSVGFCQWWVAFVLIFTCVPYNFVYLLLSFFNGHQSWDVKVIEIMTQMMLFSFLHEKKKESFYHPESVHLWRFYLILILYEFGTDLMTLLEFIQFSMYYGSSPSQLQTKWLQSYNLPSSVLLWASLTVSQPHSSFTLLLNIQLLAISLVIRRHSRANNAESWILLWTATKAQILAWHCLLLSIGLNGHLF